MTGLNNLKTLGEPSQIATENDSTLSLLVDELHTNLCDDFNTAKALATLFEMTSRINDIVDGRKNINDFGKEMWESFSASYQGIIIDVLGLKEESASNDNKLNNVVELLINIRNEAKRDRDYGRSDQIRDELKKAGIVLMDGKDNTTYSIE